MSEKSEQFECVMEPSGTWMVWDRHLEAPVQFSVLTLIGLTQSEAFSLCRLLRGLPPDEEDLGSRAS